jgi:hypothetical protein
MNDGSTAVKDRFCRLRMRDERRVDIHSAFLTLGCARTCFNTHQQEIWKLLEIPHHQKSLI